MLATPAAALAANGYTDTGTTTYVVNVAKSEIDVTVQETIKNTTPSKTTLKMCGTIPFVWDCSTIEEYYFYDTFIWVPNEAGPISATSNAGKVTQSVYKTDAYGRELKLTFPKLYYGQTRVVTSKYTIPAGPRASGDYRALKAYASLCADSNGEDSGVVNVQVPDGLNLIVTDGTSLSMTGDAKGIQTWSSGSIAGSNGFYSCVEATDSAALTSSTVTAGDQTFDVQSWPEDTTWATAMQTDLTADVPKLEDLTGLQMPGGTIDITEASETELGDYAGVYNSTDKTATITEDTDNSTVAHELSHIWFNKDLFASVWMDEGFAGYSEKVAGTGNYTPCTDPGTYPGSGSPRLTLWTYVDINSSTDDLALAKWQYAASCYLVTQLADAIGPTNFKTVLVAASKGQMAYSGGDPSQTGATPGVAITAKNLLDLIDELGMVPAGVTDQDMAQNLFLQYGILTTADLAGRSQARTDYHALLGAAGKWGLPLAVRDAMVGWNFPTAEAAMKTATQILAERDQIAKALPGFSVDGTALEKMFENAKTTTDLDAVLTEAKAEAAAAATMSQAAQLKDGSHNVLQTIGLMGTDLAAPITQANTDLTNGKPADATTEAQKVIDEVNGSSSQGLLRSGAVLALLLVLLAVVLFVVWRLRRRAAVVVSADGSLAFAAAPPSDTEPVTPAASTEVADTGSATAGRPPAEPPM